MKIEQFEELRLKLVQFQGRLQEHLLKQSAKSLDLIESYRSNKEEFNIMKANIEQQQIKLREEEDSLRKQIGTLQERTQQATAKRDAFEIKKTHLLQERAILELDRRELRELLNNKQQELQRRKEAFGRQLSRNSPEVRIYEQLLGLRIDAVHSDTLRFTFFNVREDDLSAKCTLTLDLTPVEGYTIIDPSPRLSNAVLRELEKELAVSGNLSTFLKQSRNFLISAMTSETC